MASHAIQFTRESDNRAFLVRKPVQKAGHLANYRPIESVCERIYRDWLRGITERSLSATYRFTRDAIEEICREQAQLTAQTAAALQRGAGRMALVLMGICGYQAYEATIREDQQSIARAFRGRKTRKRGLEDALKIRVYRMPALVSGGMA